MVTKTLRIFAVCMLIGSIAFAGTKAKKSLNAVADPEIAPSSVIFNTGNTLYKTALFPYVVIDSMNNSLGPANSGVDPIAFDPYSKVVVIIHRSKTSYGGGSGNIFYQYSADSGHTWSSHIGPMAGGLGANTGGRYPSVTLLNPKAYTKKDSVLVEAVFPYLIGGAAFGGMIYSVDPGVGAGSAIAAIDTVASRVWSSQMWIWASNTSNDVWFTGANSVAGGPATLLFHSSDGVAYHNVKAPQYADSVFFSVAGFFGAYQSPNTYLGMDARFKRAAPADTSTNTFGVSKSTDKGETWSNFDIVNWHAFTGFATGKLMITNHPTENATTNKFTVDGSGGIHWATVFVDTTVKPNKWSVYDVYKASGGTWTPNKVRDLPTHENWTYGVGGSPLDQTGIELETSLSQDGKLVAFKWVEDTQGATFKDSLPVPDIYLSIWNSTNKTWTTPQNITNSPTEVDYITHIAPVFENNGTVYLMRTMEASNNAGYNPLKPNESNVAVVYFTKFKGVITGVGRESGIIVGSYALSQNYPNPFNPSTQINVTLPVSGQTTLKVYNMLGQEVTTLLSGFKQAGSYFVTFDASKLSSGVYFYTLQSGSFSSTKKMVLMK